MRLGMVDCPFNPDCHLMAQGRGSQVWDNLPVSGWSGWTPHVLPHFLGAVLHVQMESSNSPSPSGGPRVPQRVFTNDGYYHSCYLKGYISPLIYARGPFKTCCGHQLLDGHLALWGGCYFYYYSHFKVEETDMMGVVPRLGRGAGTRIPSPSTGPFCSQATLVPFSSLGFLRDTISLEASLCL